ncbi:MAG: YmdB family metallophosphoesterase [Puniceicoccales bacterium]|jgi:metallophosphoesterase (TIGR00282 family)|nr:YmdB family metallophosphoesterase [Puniceicoccales bacterium]
MRKLLFLGDIVGAPGRAAVLREIPRLRAESGLEWVVVNGENAAGGNGITRALATELAAAGADVITLGDHTWDQRGFDHEIAATPAVCRPANMPAQCPGAPFRIATGTGGSRLLVFTVLGRQFMRQHVACPFETADRLLRDLAGQYDAALVEIHAETTSEKIALGWFLDGRAAAVVGTHTHVATADARVLPRGTAHQTDAGMCGAHEGVIGRDTTAVIAAFLDGMPRRFDIATGDVRLNGLLVTVGDDGLATAAERFERAVSAGI